jgi:hypothetical protein
MAKSRIELVRLADQMVSQYSRLRDRYQRMNRLTFGMVALLSVLSLTFALTPSALAEWLSMDVFTAELIVGISSAAAFVLSLLGLVFRWTERATKFAESAARCADLKLALREMSDDLEAQNLYRVAMGTLVPIPDGAFVGLKAHHLRKVAASRFLDDHPGIPGWLARLMVTLRSWRSTEQQVDEAGD